MAKQKRPASKPNPTRGGPDDGRLNLRVPPDLVKRLDALGERRADIPELRLAGSIDRSKVARVALLRGVEALERETARTDGGRAL